MKTLRMTATLAILFAHGNLAPAQAPIQFVDVSDSAGIQAYSNQYGMGAGVAAADFDGDGDVDFFVPTSAGQPHQLYRNLGNGAFEEIAVATGLGGLDPDESLGVSLVPWIRDRRSRVKRDFIVAEDSRSVAIRTRKLKLIASLDGAAAVLYDLEADPGERHDAAAERPRDVARLRRHLRDWRASLQPLETRETELDEETLRGLKALGYVE